jgi:hypothetical protein
MYDAVNEVRRLLIASFDKGRPPPEMYIPADLYARMHAEIKKHQADFGARVMYRRFDETKDIVIDDAPDWYPGVLLMNVSIWPKMDNQVAA